MTYSGVHLDQVHPRPQTLDPAFTKMYWIELNRAITPWAETQCRAAEIQQEMLAVVLQAISDKGSFAIALKQNDTERRHA